jgi:glycosyltransferase involved in cell wall biosynthesis
MSYAPIFSEPTSNILNNPNRRTKNHSFSNNSKSNAHPEGWTPTASPRNGRSQSRQKRRSKKNSEEYSLLVHCHLCWNWVWQRPQQFVSRLSRKRRVIFVETVAPAADLLTPSLRFRQAEGFPNITILTVQFPAWRWNDGAFVDKERRRLVKEFLASPMAGDLGPIVQWFYDPMGVPAFAAQMKEILTVYDCMDELSKFRCAPPELIQREADLLARADVVFTGGRKLFESKSRHNSNCHFYGCGVDVEHFGGARKEDTEVPAELARMKKPVLGYFGVVDERIDYELLAKLADANPEWSVAMIGPVMKVDAAMLPQRPNLHWLGQQPYEKLPAFCKGFDICLMPFALNESTEFINPTKALEYMATGRPIVSSAVPDVVRNFGSVVQVARSQEEFIDLCRAAIQKPDTSRIEGGLKMAAENSWERIVSELEGHVAAALKTKESVEVAA